MQATCLVPPASEPVSLEEAKSWLRLDSGDEDAIVTALVASARAAVEAATSKLLVMQTWRLVLDEWPRVATGFCSVAPPGSAMLTIPLGPVASITAIRIYDASGTPQVVSPATYALRGAPDDRWIDFIAAPPSPSRTRAGIEIDIVAGFGAPADVPQPLRQAILMLVARLYENRGDGMEPAPEHLRGAVHSLIAPFRRPRLV